MGVFYNSHDCDVFFVQERHSVKMVGYMRLTEEQGIFGKAFSTERDNILLLALPGSGKTTSSLAATVQLLNLNPNSRPWLISFSNAAASNMLSRLKLLLSKQLFQQVGVSTFHAINLEQYQKLPNHKQLLIGASQDSLILRAMNLSCFDGDIKDAKMEIDQLTRRMSISASMKTPLYNSYMALLQKYNKIDFNLLCIEVVKGMRAGLIPTLNITHLLVDEFQDTDEVQLAWMKCHAQKNVITACVGDDDQSIYGFRGALGYNVMDAYLKDFQAKIMYISSCFRCGKTILYAAEALITNNEKRLEKSMNAAAEFDGDVEIRRSGNKSGQHELVAEKIQATQGEWAVLARNNTHLDEMELVLSMKKIPYQRLQSGSIWDSYAADATLKLLDIIATQKISMMSHDALAFFGLNEDQIDMLTKHKGMGGLSTVILDAPLPSNIKRLLLTLVAIAGDTSSPDEIGKKIKRLKEDIDGIITSKRDKAVINVVLDILGRQPGSWREMLQSMVAKLSGRRSKKIELNSTLVALTTLHGSKGLEWENVAIINMTEGVFPAKDIVEKEDIEEERRLAFVGMTRAIKHLELHYYDEPNRFIAEIMAKMVTEDQLSA